MELLIARNPDEASTLPYLLKVPLGDGLVFRARDTWPRTTAVYLHPVWADEWPDTPEIVERVPVRSCVRRGAAIDLVLDRGRENRSQIVYTTARGREVVFWQSPRTRKQARPQVNTPTARAAGLADLPVVVDSHERYAYTFADKPVTVTRRALRCGDYGLEHQGRLVAAVERKSLADLVASLTSGKLKFALADLAALPRAALVVEDRYSRVYALTRVRPAVVADGLAEVQVAWPNVPIVFCETRKLAEEWTYRFLAAAHVWAVGEAPAVRAGNGPTPATTAAPVGSQPSTRQIRAWARLNGINVPDRGRLRPEVIQAWHDAHPSPTTPETD
ncbi:histone-like nucleoid-structuring protein Lsr2 [Polymorphospora sp. NPDC051019]|uniref:ERCC4 domain-containing protein n=1 Tax=Polymorphospora sp. NPDC051019 TaxID=3155725 RepID=UPI0034121216